MEIVRKAPSGVLINRYSATFIRDFIMFIDFYYYFHTLVRSS